MDEAEKSSGTLRQKLLQIKIKIKIQKTLFKKGQADFFGILKVPGGRGIILIIFLVLNIREGYHYGPFLLVVLEENDRSFFFLARWRKFAITRKTVPPNSGITTMIHSRG